MKYIQGTGKPNTEAQLILSVINTIEGYKWSVRWFCGAKCVRLEAPMSYTFISNMATATGDREGLVKEGGNVGVNYTKGKGRTVAFVFGVIILVCLQTTVKLQLASQMKNECLYII